MRRESVDVAIVGGGISGLYCAFKRHEQGRSVRLFEASSRIGGRIETWTVDSKQDLYAEFGPMRIEPKHQPILKALLDEINITEENGGLVEFSPYTSEDYEEIQYKLEHEESQQTSLSDLLKLGLRRVFQLLAPLEWSSNEAKREFERFMTGRGDHSNDAFDRWISTLKERDFDTLRQKGVMTRPTYSVPLWKMGFWNVLSDVLSHNAVLKIRDCGTFYHLLPENPNAVEWIIFWLRGFQTSDSLRGVAGGMERIIRSTRAKLPKELVRPGCTLVNIATKSQKVVLDFDGNDPMTVRANEAILALPKSPLLKLSHCFGDEIVNHLDAVFGFSLVKCFFVFDKAWWNKDRKPNLYANRVPTRELHYWKGEPSDGDDAKGMIMAYTDRPGDVFWRDYLLDGRRDKEQLRHLKFSAKERPRLVEKVLQYMRENGFDEYTKENVLQCAIRDWSREPYGGACHAWKSGRRSWLTINALKAFSLVENGSNNIHVCGEAYSDYQGFIEGALRSAELALATIN